MLVYSSICDTISGGLALRLLHLVRRLLCLHLLTSTLPPVFVFVSFSLPLSTWTVIILPEKFPSYKLAKNVASFFPRAHSA